MAAPAYALVNSSGVVVNLLDITPVPAGAQGANTYVPPAGLTQVPTNGATVLVGSTCANGVFTAPATPAPTTASLESAVDTQRDSLLATGFFDSTTQKTWQCDPVSRGYLTALGASAFSTLASSPQPTFTLISSDNTTVSLDSSDTYALINGRIMPWVSNMVLYARTLKNQIVAGNPPASLETGWPTS